MWRLRAFVLTGAIVFAGLGGASPAHAIDPVGVENLSSGGMLLRNIEYCALRGYRPLALDLYLPRPQGRPVPVVLWAHGGGWWGQSKEQDPAEGLTLDQLTRHGYAVAAVSYRLSGEAIFPAQIQDVKAAVRWLRANASVYGLDTARIGAWGRSSGGHLVSLLGTTRDDDPFEASPCSPAQSSAVQAVVNWYGPQAFTAMDAQGSELKHNDPRSPESRLLGCPIQECPDKAERANPMRYISAGDPPFLIVHGTADTWVPPVQSATLRDALKAAGVEAELVSIEGAGHGGPQFAKPAVFDQLVKFLDRHLK